MRGLSGALRFLAKPSRAMRIAKESHAFRWIFLRSSSSFKVEEDTGALSDLHTLCLDEQTHHGQHIGFRLTILRALLMLGAGSPRMQWEGPWIRI
jgi:hypothetical protein